MENTNTPRPVAPYKGGAMAAVTAAVISPAASSRLVPTAARSALVTSSTSTWELMAANDSKVPWRNPTTVNISTEPVNE